MSGKSGIGLALIVLVGGYLAYAGLKPTVFPNMAVASSTESFEVEQLRGDKPRLVMVMLLPGCGFSRFAGTTLKAEYPKYESRAAFVGVLLSDPGAAEAFQKEHELPFPVYALNPQANPVAYNQMVEAVGGWRKRFFGGTVLVLDAARRIKKQVNGNELEKLVEKLAGT